MKVFIFFALFCLAVASASVIGPIGLGGVAISPLGVPLAGHGVVVGGLGVHGLIAPGLVGHVGHVGAVKVIG